MPPKNTQKVKYLKSDWNILSKYTWKFVKYLDILDIFPGSADAHSANGMHSSGNKMHPSAVNGK